MNEHRETPYTLKLAEKQVAPSGNIPSHSKPSLKIPDAFKSNDNTYTCIEGFDSI